MESRVDTGFAHDEADITMVAYTLQAAESVKMVIRFLSDDTGVFVLLMYWICRMLLYSTCCVQMARWNGAVTDINATCLELGEASTYHQWRSQGGSGGHGGHGPPQTFGGEFSN